MEQQKACRQINISKNYCKNHHAAHQIQRCWRRYFANKKDNINRAKETANQRPEESEYKHNAKLFKGFNFVLSGCIPKLGSKKMTQAAFKTFLMEYGARVRPRIPGRRQSTKKYIILASKSAFNPLKVPNPIRQAISCGHKIMDFSFVTACIQEGKIAEEGKYLIDVSKVSSGITRNVSLQKRHFSKKLTFLTMLKKPRKNKHTLPITRKNPKRRKAAKSAALYFALKKRKLLLKGKKVTFAEAQTMLKDLFKEWTMMPAPAKEEAKMEWQRNVADMEKMERQQMNREQQLLKNNDLNKPAYMDFLP